MVLKTLLDLVTRTDMLHPKCFHICVLTSKHPGNTLNIQPAKHFDILKHKITTLYVLTIAPKLPN